MSISIDVDHGLCKRSRGFLGKIVTDAAGDGPVCVFAGESLAIGRRISRVWCTICIAFEGNRRHGDGRKLSELLFELVILRFAFSQSDPEAIVVNNNSNVIRIVEGRRGAIEGGIVEVPLGRSDLPNELRKIATVLVVAGPAALRGEVTGTIIGVRLLAATASCWLQDWRSDSHSLRRAPCSAQARESP